MPFVSNTQLAKLERIASHRHHAAVSSGAHNKLGKAAGMAFQTAEVVGGAMLISFVRGKMEDKATGAWNVPHTSNIDVELVAGLGLLGAAYFKAFGSSYANDLANVGNGVLAHYMGQVARKFAHTGTFSLIAGSAQPSLLMAGQPAMHGGLRDAMRSAV